MRTLITGISICAFFFLACEESEVGCLDLLAENYGFEAVSECDSCCAYPSVSIDFDLVYDTLSYSFGDTIVRSNSDTLIVEGLNLLLSGFEFSNDQRSYEVLDSFTRKKTTIRDDYILLRASSLKAIGDARIEDSISLISFRSGFEELKVATIKPFDEVDQNSNIDLALDSLYNEDIGVYYLGNMRIKNSVADSAVVFEFDNSLSEDFNFDLDKIVSAGDDWEVNLILDLFAVLDGLDMQQDQDLIEAELVQRINNSIELK